MKMRLTGVAGEDWIFKHEGGECPQVGFLYELENIQSGTAAQNKAFHSLLDAFYLWMVRNDEFQFEYSGSVIEFPARSQKDFREFFKYHYGAGATHYEFVDDDMKMVRVSSLDEIPAHILSGDDFANKNKALKLLRSCLSDFIAATGKENRRLLNEMVYIKMKDFYGALPNAKTGRVKAVLKSWTNYSKKERRMAIDRLKDIIKAVSCHDPKVKEIMEGMESNEK
jgi:hypothetical protein